MLFVTNNANSSSYTHHIKEQFCLPKEKDMTSHLQLDFNDRLIYTGNKVKSSKGKKRLQSIFTLLEQYPIQERTRTDFYSKLHFDLSKTLEQESKAEYYTVKDAMKKIKLPRELVYGSFAAI